LLFDALKFEFEYCTLHLANRNSKQKDQVDLSKNKGKCSRKGSTQICITLNMDMYGLKLSKGQEHEKNDAIILGYKFHNYFWLFHLSSNHISIDKIITTKSK